MLAYHNDPALKAATIAEMRAHRDADRIVQGRYWDGGRGCAVGCLTHDPDGGHDQYPLRWGIPESLAWLEDAIFERLTAEEAREWPLAFLEAIPVGADLSGVADRFKLWLLTDSGLLDRSRPDVAAAIDRVADLLSRRIAGTEPGPEEWSAAESAAWSAAESAAESARSAESAAARSAAWRKIADRLLLLLRESGAAVCS